MSVITESCPIFDWGNVELNILIVLFFPSFVKYLYYNISGGSHIFNEAQNRISAFIDLTLK